MYVFWPRNVRISSGEVYGWISSVIIVATTHTSAPANLTHVGTCGSLDAIPQKSQSIRKKCKHTPFIHFSRGPKIIHVSCRDCGQELDMQCRIVNFAVPNTARRQYYSLKPLILNLHAYNPLPNGEMDESMSEILERLNSVSAIQQSLKPFKIPQILKKPLPIIRNVVTPMLILMRWLAEGILLILNHPIIFGSSLKHFSWTLQQVDLRLHQYCFMPSQISTFRRDGSMERRNLDYLSFFNVIWLVANDLIIGWAFGKLVLEHEVYFARNFELLFRAGIRGMRSLTHWLMEGPGGLKLNDQLDNFLGELFLWLLDVWEMGLSNVEPILAQLVNFGGLLGTFGCSFLVAYFNDLISLAVLHIYLFFTVSARLYHWTLTTMIALFYLFQGKKRNVLLQRIDLNNYTLDQLILGTLIFTLLIFLFPTVLVYFALFAMVRILRRWLTL